MAHLEDSTDTNPTNKGLKHKVYVLDTNCVYSFF